MRCPTTGGRSWTTGSCVERCNRLPMPIIDHCEDVTLSGCGCMNDGPVSRALGLRYIPSAAEERMVKRDIMLAQETGVRLHVVPVSAEGSVKAVRCAKEEGLPVTAEASPHHVVADRAHERLVDPEQFRSKGWNRRLPDGGCVPGDADVRRWIANGEYIRLRRCHLAIIPLGCQPRACGRQVYA